MKTKMVSYTLETLPRLTKADCARLKALAARPDSEIDTSDIPEMTDEQWKKAVRGAFYRPKGEGAEARVRESLRAIWMSSPSKRKKRTCSAPTQASFQAISTLLTLP